MQNIQRYFPNLTQDQIEKFAQLQTLYAYWNSRINVISRRDIDNLYQNHVLHSLSISKIVDFVASTKILDVGTGGGFPGIPLAILYPNVDFLLIDSIGKKIKVVQEITNTLELKNVRMQHIRAEQVNEKFDFIVSRAVTEMPVFLTWIKNKILSVQKNTIPNGLLYLKGGDLSEELKGIRSVQLFDIDNYFSEDFFTTKKIVYIPR